MTQNIGMNLGLLPVTGLPLPFVSYGGSSMLLSWLAVGPRRHRARRPRPAPVNLTAASGVTMPQLTSNNWFPPRWAL